MQKQLKKTTRWDPKDAWGSLGSLGGSLGGTNPAYGIYMFGGPWGVLGGAYTYAYTYAYAYAYAYTYTYSYTYAYASSYA